MSAAERLEGRSAVWPWAVVGLTIGGAVLRVLVAGQDLFADELATYWVATAHGFTGVVETVATTAEITPPLSFLLTWLSTRLGESPELVRLPALVAGVASIPLVYAVGVRAVGRGAAMLAAALTALSPFMIFYSAEARGYGVLMALLLVSTWALLRAVEGEGWGCWVLYGVAVALSAYTHYTALYVLAAQVGWAWWVHPRSRRPLLVATGIGALSYLPWLPSLKGDLDSPTTEILGNLSPIDPESVRLTLGHWAVGFPFGLPATSLRDLPGILPLFLLAVSVGIGIHAGLRRSREREPTPTAGTRHGVALVGLLAVATPLLTFLQSLVTTNVFATRSLAASWPYLALTVAALIAMARPTPRRIAAGLAVAVFAVAAITMLTADFKRPAFDELARFADEHPGAVVINNAAFTPGPLTNFEVEGSTTNAPIIRMNVPAQMESPFTLVEPRPDPAAVVREAVERADGGAIIILSGVPQPAEVDVVVEMLPPDYQPTEVKTIGGLFDVQAVVYERDASS